MGLVLLVVVGLVDAGGSTSSGQAADPCTRCKDKSASWDWKANGYALASTADEALALAEKRATDAACTKSGTYLDAQKLKCSGGCNEGEVSTACAPSKKPGCNTGTYDKNKGMWTFVCRKHYQDAEDKPGCDKKEAEKNPGYTMCDVSVRAVRTLPCTHPDCTDGASEGE